MLGIAEVLESIQNSDVFFHFEEDHIDWTDNTPVSLVIHCNGRKSIITLDNPKEIEKLGGKFIFLY